MNDAILRQLAAAAAARGGDAVGVAVRAIAERAGSLSGIRATTEGDAVALQGKGLLARAFGSRRRAADPRLLALTANLQSTGEQP
jgi:hypothetical protein